jgi:hypothetical protein
MTDVICVSTMPYAGRTRGGVLPLLRHLFQRDGRDICRRDRFSEKLPEKETVIKFLPRDLQREALADHGKK